MKVFVVQQVNNYETNAEVIGVYTCYETAVLHAKNAEEKAHLESMKYEIHEFELNIAETD